MDKNVVDRTRREGKSARAVKDVRHRLNSPRADAHEFERELLRSFAQNHINAAFLFPAIIIAVGIVSFQWLGLTMSLVWASLMMLAYGLFLLLCRRLVAVELSDVDPVLWKRRFMRSIPIIGMGWVALFLKPDPLEMSLNIQVMQFSVLLCVMALVAMTSYSIKFFSLMAIGPAALLLTLRFGVNFDPVSITMGAVLISAQAFFSVMGNRLYFNASTNLKNQAEKDQLIAELEMASSISEESRRRAEEANLAKSRFLATMSHELRTPLNAILGFSEVMVKEVLGPLNNKTYREYLSDIHSSGSHLLELINEILDLSRVEAGRYNLHEEAVYLDYLVSDCEQLIKLKAKNKGIKINKQCELDLPKVWIDERAIRQVILNLLSNALKFTPTSGTIWIKIGWTAGGGQYVSIRDNGPGIPEDEIPVVLSSFGQGSIAIKSAEQGTGLGLPIVQALIEKHQGAFELKSKLRAGTEVIITLPSTRVMEVMEPIGQESPSMTTPEPEKKRGRSLFESRKNRA